MTGLFRAFVGRRKKVFLRRPVTEISLRSACSAGPRDRRCLYLRTNKEEKATIAFVPFARSQSQNGALKSGLNIVAVEAKITVLISRQGHIICLT